MRWRSLEELRARDEASAELRALVAHRRGLVEEQARGITRLRALLLEVFPGLEAALDLRKDRALLVLAKVVTPSAARRLGASRLARWLRARGVRRSEELAGKVLEAAKAQRTELPAAEAKGALVAEKSAEVLRTRGRVAALDARMEELLSERPQEEVVRSLPGMGPLFTAEFLAEVGDVARFASANALAHHLRAVHGANLVTDPSRPGSGPERALPGGIRARSSPAEGRAGHGPPRSPAYLVVWPVLLRAF